MAQSPKAKSAKSSVLAAPVDDPKPARKAVSPAPKAVRPAAAPKAVVAAAPAALEPEAKPVVIAEKPAVPPVAEKPAAKASASAPKGAAKPTASAKPAKSSPAAATKTAAKSDTPKPAATVAPKKTKPAAVEPKLVVAAAAPIAALTPDEKFVAPVAAVPAQAEQPKVPPAAPVSVTPEAPVAKTPEQPKAAASASATAETAGVKAGARATASAGPQGAEGSYFAYMVRDPEAFARNVARMIEGAGKAAAAYLKPREEGLKPASNGDELVGVFKTLASVGEYWLAEPTRALDAQARLWSGYMDVWNRTLQRMGGEKVEPAIKPDARDKRFQDPEWSNNQFFDFIKQMYLTTSKWADEMVEGAAVDEHTRLKAEFYVRQIADAIAPSNFVLTNPELLRETLANNGENLVRGMQMLAEDIAAGGGDLRIRQTSGSNFQIGVNMATTPGKVIYQNDVCQILQYEPSTKDVYKRPLLIVPPWINKFYILDLNPEKSFIKWAVDQGHTVFTISWVNPDERQAKKSFEEYMKEGILTALDTIEKATGEREIDAIGYCVGGTLLAVTLAWCAATGDDRIKSATFFTTQVDFTYAGGLKAFVDEEQIQILEASMQVRGYLEGQKMAASFNMLRPNDLIWPYVINNYMRGKDPFPFDLLYWNSDATRMPAANHSFYLRNCYLDNKLSRGLMELSGVRLDLGKVTIPVYNLATREDHIAPAKSVFVGSGAFGGPVEYVLSGSGHIAGVVNPPAKGKYQYWTGGNPEGEYEEWVAKASETAGSWWPHWEKWLVAQSDGAMVPARTPGGGRLNAIEDAPGSYVKMKA
jgi:polyhydroxyalkanoate synthase